MVSKLFVKTVMGCLYGLCLGGSQCRFEMIEHVMAALSGLQIDNVQVFCTASEMPAMDGSSFPLTVALLSVGKFSFGSKREARSW